MLAIREVNLGTYAFDAEELFSALDEVRPTDGELYLTEALPVIVARGDTVAIHSTDDAAVRARRERPRGPDGGRGRWPSGASSNSTPARA